MQGDFVKKAPFTQGRLITVTRLRGDIYCKVGGEEIACDLWWLVAVHWVARFINFNFLRRAGQFLRSKFATEQSGVCLHHAFFYQQNFFTAALRHRPVFICFFTDASHPTPHPPVGGIRYSQLSVDMQKNY